MMKFNVTKTFGSTHKKGEKAFPRGFDSKSDQSISKCLAEIDAYRVDNNRKAYTSEQKFEFMQRVNQKNDLIAIKKRYAYIHKNKIHRYIEDIEGALDYNMYMARDKDAGSFQLYVLENIEQHKKLSSLHKEILYRNITNFNGMCVPKQHFNHKFDMVFNLSNGKKCGAKNKHFNYMACTTCNAVLAKVTCFEGRIKIYDFAENHDCKKNKAFMAKLNLAKLNKLTKSQKKLAAKVKAKKKKLKFTY